MNAEKTKWHQCPYNVLSERSIEIYPSILQQQIKLSLPIYTTQIYRLAAGAVLRGPGRPGPPPF